MPLSSPGGGGGWVTLARIVNFPLILGTPYALDIPTSVNLVLRWEFAFTGPGGVGILISFGSSPGPGFSNQALSDSASAAGALHCSGIMSFGPTDAWMGASGNFGALGAAGLRGANGAACGDTQAFIPGTTMTFSVAQNVVDVLSMNGFIQRLIGP